jgi:pilus assembly protein Flp/PilA
VIAPRRPVPLRFEGASGLLGQRAAKLNLLQKKEKGDFQMINMLKNLHKEDSGQDLIEYGLIALIVALGAVAGMGTLAKSINGLFSTIAGDLS